MVTDNWVGNNDEAVFFWVGKYATLSLQEHGAKVCASKVYVAVGILIPFRSMFCFAIVTNAFLMVCVCVCVFVFAEVSDRWAVYCI